MNRLVFSLVVGSISFYTGIAARAENIQKENALPPYDVCSPHSQGRFAIPPRNELEKSRPWLNCIAEKIQLESSAELSKLPKNTEFTCVLLFHSGSFFKQKLKSLDSTEEHPLPWKSYVPQTTKSSGSQELDNKLLSLVQKASPVDNFAPFLCGYRFPIYLTIKFNSVKAHFGGKSEVMDSYFLNFKRVAE